MEFSGTQTITVPQQIVWEYLEDVNKVAECVPGFQSLEEIEPEHWKALISVGIGPVKAKFTLDIVRPEMRRPDLMIVKGRGKAPGSAVELEGTMTLSPAEADQTTMDWRAHVIVSGTLASVGARLMNSTAEKLTEQFFSCLKTHLQAPSNANQ
ncbi:CoxG family protein [Tengunoibacter tsumagoiensis]|uniref:Carbon monoxide dehydrogenase n=1 Tax=Tengunoibacter tsumagoiensis TaxID=2014871 RepID=A0A402A1Z3_9CHLR|nr:carbon monoxide dehydrogenase subunit G [Tengunoibacter tsumagoiensis]GCE13170.1 carbon monoxide dehydrogenase [Tengunoibacter tsumagoiensis]